MPNVVATAYLIVTVEHGPLLGDMTVVGVNIISEDLEHVTRTFSRTREPLQVWKVHAPTYSEAKRYIETAIANPDHHLHRYHLLREMLG